MRASLMNHKPARVFLILAASILGLAAVRADAASAPTPEALTITDSGRDDLNFQSLLMDLALEPADRAYCNGKVGLENSENETEYGSCRVTRNFLWYIRVKPKVVKGRFPPMADIRYCRTKAERKELFARVKDGLE